MPIKKTSNVSLDTGKNCFEINFQTHLKDCPEQRGDSLRLLSSDAINDDWLTIHERFFLQQLHDRGFPVGILEQAWENDGKDMDAFRKMGANDDRYLTPRAENSILTGCAKLSVIGTYFS